MAYTSPAVVIDNGSYTTKAGFASEDLPSLVFNTNYSVDNNSGAVVVGDDAINAAPENEVMTLLDNGIIYNFDNIVHNWNYVYDNIDNQNPIDAKEFPLVLTEQSWNTSKNRLTTTQIAFETLEVPIFSLVKTPIAQLYRAGRSTGLVIDIGGAVTSVTPILDGIIQHKSSFHSKFAGDFLNLHVLNYLESKTAIENLLPPQYHGPASSESFKNYFISHTVLQDYKSLALSYQLRDYQLPNGSHISVADSRNYLENLFQPTVNKLPNITIPEPAIDKPHTHGLTNLIFLCLKSLEATLLPTTNDSSSHNKLAKFTEIFKDLLSNILITGGTSTASGLPESIINDIRAMTQQYYSNYPFSYATYPIRHSTGDSSEIWDRQFGAWLGACNLASMLNDSNAESNSVKIALDNWFVTKADYEELGEDLIVDKFK
ncbi:general RNA polymerase II transcription factor [Scheffersomyces xylosifermentans]|uniref:general RNA polymerase II transcription factor n=1 Tax=Scheffersomyces xylosifermentans TaxID=1304137 RepID=UPI00315D311D